MVVADNGVSVQTSGSPSVIPVHSSGRVDTDGQPQSPSSLHSHSLCPITDAPISQSVGHIPAADRILEATYRALLQLPSSYLPAQWSAPMLQPQLPPGLRSRVASPAPSGANTPRSRLPPLKESLFAYCWIALAGMTTPADAAAFTPFVSNVLSTPAERISMTNGGYFGCMD